MDTWEQEQLDNKSTAEVALELHVARLEQEKVESEVFELYSAMVAAERAYNLAKRKHDEVSWKPKDQNDRVREIEQYLNRRLGA